MKKFALATVFALLCCLQTFAQTTTTASGTFRDLTGAVIPTGQVTFELKPAVDTTIAGYARFTPQTVSCTIAQSQNATLTRDGAGNVSAVFAVAQTFVVGDVVNVQGWTDSSFDGTFTLATVADNLHATWAQSGTASTATSGYLSALRSSPGPSACTVTQTTAITPQNTFYQVCLWPNFARTSCFNLYALTNSVDLSTVMPAPGQTPAYPSLPSSINTQQGGSSLGAASVVNCSTNLTCTNSNGVLTIVATGGVGCTIFASPGKFIEVNGAGNGCQPAPVMDETTFLYANLPWSVFDINTAKFIDCNHYSCTDIGAGINAAYADLPAVGGAIYVPPVASLTASTAINFGTANKPVHLICAPGTALDWASGASGNFITVNNGSGGSATAVGGSIISGCTLNGTSSTNSAVALFLGGANGASSFLGDHITIQNFGECLDYGNNTFATVFDGGSILQECNQLLIVPSGLTNSGENLSFKHTRFSAAATFTNAVEIAAGVAGETSFDADSFDNAQLVNGSQATVTASHFEDAGVNQANPYVVNTGGMVLDHDEMFQDSGSPAMTTMISNNTAASSGLTVVGLDATSAGTITNLITDAGSGSLTFIGPRTINPFTNFLNYTGSGCYWMDFGGGQAKTNCVQQFGPSIVINGAPGATTTNSGQIAYDTTNQNFRVNDGGDVPLAPLAPGFVSGNCGEPTQTAGKWLTVDAGSPCGGSGGGGANQALSNLSGVSINTSLLAQTGVDLGSATNPFRNLYLFGAGTYGTNYFELTGTPSSTRTQSLQDASDTFVYRSTPDTLTNKTLAGAAITGAFTGTGAYLPVSLFNSGTGASSSTYWRGDGTWGTPPGGGNVSTSGTPTSGTPTEFAGSTTIKNGVLADFEAFGLLNNCMTTAGDMIVGGSSGTCSRLAVNSTSVPETPVSVGGATSLTPSGILPRDVTGTTNTDTIAGTDCSSWVNYEGSVAVATSLPTPTTLTVPNCVFHMQNITSGSATAVTFTATTFTFKSTGNTTRVVSQGQACSFDADAANSIWVDDCHDLPLQAGSNITITRGQFGTTISSSGGSGLSGMTAGQIPKAATASTVTSSIPLQGTDTAIMTAGAVAASQPIACTDAAGGITTTGCSAGGGSGALNQSVGFTSATSATLTVANSTPSITWSCWDSATPANAIYPANVSVNQSTFLVTFTFSVAQTGFCTVNSSGSGIYENSESGSSWVINAASHLMGANVRVTTYDSSGNQIFGNVAVDSSGNVTISWLSSQSGKVIITP